VIICRGGTFIVFRSARVLFTSTSFAQTALGAAFIGLLGTCGYDRPDMSDRLSQLLCHLFTSLTDVFFFQEVNMGRRWFQGDEQDHLATNKRHAQITKGPLITNIFS